MLEIFSPSYFLFSWWEYVFLFLIVLYGMTIRTIAGFGGISISLPLLLLFNANPLVFVPILVLQAVFVFVSMIYQERKYIDWKWVKKIFPLIIVCYIFGFLGLLEFPDYIFSFILGLCALLLASVFAWQKFFSVYQKKIAYKLDAWDYVLLVLSGYFGGLALAGGIFLTSVLLRHGIEKHLFRFLLALLGITFTFPKLLVFTGSFFYGWYEIPIDIGFIIVSTLATLLAIPLGSYVAQKFPQKTFDIAVIAVLILSAISLIYLSFVR